jgi:hypothetical protein
MTSSSRLRRRACLLLIEDAASSPRVLVAISGSAIGEGKLAGAGIVIANAAGVEATARRCPTVI